MRILMVHPHDIYSEMEPWTRRIVSIASEIAKQQNEVKLVYHLFDPHGHVKEAYSRQEYSFETIPMMRREVTALRTIFELRRLANWADVVHVQKCFAHAFVPAAAAAYRTGRPLHYDWDDWEYGIFTAEPVDAFLGKSLLEMENHAVKVADTIAVASDGLRQRCLALGFRPDRLFHAPVGADLEQFHPRVDGSRVRQHHGISGPIVVYAGQLSGAQYAEMFLAAARVVIDAGAAATFVVVGGGDRFERVVRRSHELGIQNRVVFTGAVSADKVPEYLAAADIAVAVLADTEQQRCKSPLKVAEYMAAGKAIVATDVGQVRYFLDDCGIMVPPSSPDALASGIIDLLGNEGRIRELGRKARSRAEAHCGWSVAAANTMSAYEKALELRNRKPSQPALHQKKAQKSPREFENDPFVWKNLDLVGIMDGECAYKGPKMAQIDLTNNCNNDCIGCWCNSPLLLEMRMPQQIKKQTLPTERVFELLEELHEMGTEAIYYAGGGEPFMHPEIMAILRRTKELGLICHVNTNCTLIDKRRAETLCELRVDYIRASIWAATPETYSATHPNKSGAKLLQLREVLAHLAAHKQGDFPRIEIYNVISRLNCSEIEQMVDFALEVGADGVEFAPIDVIPGYTDSLLLTREERQAVLEQCRSVRTRMTDEGRVGRLMVFRFNEFERRMSGTGAVTGDYDKEVIDSLPCTVGWTFTRILADGNVNGCLKAHRIPVGNVCEQRFFDIWNGGPMREFRRQTNIYKKQGPFFSKIGNDDRCEVGCYRGCDDLARNVNTFTRLQSLTLRERRVLRKTLCSVKSS